eukprot:TRINITY_DN11569_c0_g1_i1.p1 TRINITY_DN11569_c0_g1~~TRINITY_DN11569_c0_g1_i1.p1  ORF type:complete len:125 (+),score=24.12 TRINITY_DN11569_c0_g1_i1:26-376(+)
MLKPKVLPKILEQANTCGVSSTLILNAEGSLLAASGDTSSSQVIAAIVANIWHSFEKSGNLDVMLLDYEGHKMAVAEVSKLLLCVYGDASIEFGVLKAKTDTLRNYLREPLSQVIS